MSSIHSSPWINSVYENFQNGIPIGHKSINLSKKKYWHPLMSDFLLGIRHKIAIFNSYSLQKNILQAFYMIALVLKNVNNTCLEFQFTKTLVINAAIFLENISFNF